MSTVEESAPTGLLLIELDGDGSHPAAWRKSAGSPAASLGPARLRDVTLAAESAGFHAATFRDGVPGAGTNAGANSSVRLNALQRAAFVAPLTRSIALVPEVETVYTEPFHVSTQLATLDYVSRGRAGWLVSASGSAAESAAQAAAVGRRPADSDRRTREAGAAIEVSRRLWDTWEDDAVIKDVATGRYLDVDRLHYADFEGPDYSVKGPSIIPRPVQGQLPVLAPAGLLAPDAVAQGAADALLVSAPTIWLLLSELQDAAADRASALRLERGRLERGRLERGRGGAADQQPLPAFIAELDVVLDARGESASSRLAGLERYATWESPRARFVGSAAQLVELLADLLAAGAGVRLHPAVLDVDLEELAQLVLPALRWRGLLSPVTPDAPFRGLLGLPRPVSRYAAARSAVGPSADAPAWN
ncbi:LLM class flavin-dependent oxidoreductase [Pseudarthrobacter sp. J75]|uniref:LLM class flavin-dependent oxidoreductase n=1 Tax=unclassified Pseudarthrobacter TaxID=2647000 RepID=UPI002E80EB22|nr:MULTISPECIES: LLM class flavin-dependent oxidoreductase [unclassified Pseudarthrobacter]MEE2524261.1 LLM class flavin-dependent oxidoreductase [Pseudarthrobacter sp. J47]MEE2530143.1 LLM class flavin-dependent oxidoreductase [Pseudarthrobacter sp. J75]